MNKQIEQAIATLRLNSERYARPERYYNGDHDLAFATEKFQNTFGTLFREFALNLCPVICDAVRDKLRVTGFSVDEPGTQAPLPARRGSVLAKTDIVQDNAGGGGVAGKGACVPAGSLRSDARRIWQRNRMATRAGEIHKEALRSGDAYAVVWPNERGEAIIYPNKAANMTVVYDEDSPGRVAWAAKAWRTEDKHIRLNLMYPDRIEKYISRSESEGSLPDAKEFIPAGTQAPLPASRESGLQNAAKKGHAAQESGVAGWEPAFQIPNPYGVVPVFHFANNADLGATGRSELDAAIPVQDGLNKSVLDMLVAMEFSAYRQRWAAGIEIEFDADGKATAPFKAGVEHLWISENPNAKFGDFDAAQLDQFLNVKDSFRVDIASVTGTPLHYFLQNTSGFPSGESLKKSETRFLAKVRDRQESFGQVWADALAFALMIEGRGRDIRLITEWEDPAPMSEKEFLENILLKKQIGLPVDRALVEAGYGEADVRRMVNVPERDKENSQG